MQKRDELVTLPYCRDELELLDKELTPCQSEASMHRYDGLFYVAPILRSSNLETQQVLGSYLRYFPPLPNFQIEFHGINH